jgi:hypothetical protein
MKIKEKKLVNWRIGEWLTTISYQLRITIVVLRIIQKGET